MSQEQKNKISASLIGISRINTGTFKKGISRTEKEKNKISEGSIKYLMSLTSDKRKITKGHNKGKTWKVINGKRVWN